MRGKKGVDCIQNLQKVRHEGKIKYLVKLELSKLDLCQMLGFSY